MDKKTLEIFNNYGIMNQLKHFQTEIFELNEAIIQEVNSNKKDENLIQHVKEEIADVNVMLKQFQLAYGFSDDEIEEIMEEKLDRQIERIKQENS